MHPLLVPRASVRTWSIPLGRQSIPSGCQENCGELETPMWWLAPRGLGRVGCSSQAIAPGCGWDYGVSQRIPLVWGGAPVGNMDHGVLYVGWYQDGVLGVLRAMSHPGQPIPAKM